MNRPFCMQRGCAERGPEPAQPPALPLADLLVSAATTVGLRAEQV